MFIIKIELNSVNMNNFVDHNEVRLMASLNLVSEILNVPDRLTTCSTGTAEQGEKWEG